MRLADYVGLMFTDENAPQYKNPKLNPTQLAFCNELARTGALISSAHAVGWTKVQLDKERKESLEFRQGIYEASCIAGERILLELNDRAYNGELTPAINQGMPIYKRDPKTGEVELDDNFEPIVLTFRKHDKQYLFKLMEILMPEIRQGGPSVNIHTNPAGDDEEETDRNGIRIEFVMPNGRTEEYYEAIERGEDPDEQTG